MPTNHILTLSIFLTIAGAAVAAALTMPTNQMLPLLVFLTIAGAAAATAVKAPLMRRAARIVTALILSPVALFSIYGFMASMEPGDLNLPWRAVYPVVFLSCASAITRLVFARTQRDRIEST